MPAGRKPNPTAKLKLAGTLRTDKRVEVEALPAAQDLRPGQHLSTRAKRKWAKTAPLLSDNGILSEQDKQALACYCECWHRWVEARNTITRDGMWYTAANGNLVKHPATTVMEQSGLELLRWCAELGLTPSSRARIPRREAAKTPKQKLQERLGG